MPDESPFPELLRRVRAGDSGAAEELVRRFEPVIRMEVRVRLRDPRLRRFFDSMDICQSVLGSFFVGAALGRYELEEPDHLLRLLVKMARNKVAFHARWQRAEKRDDRRAVALDAAAPELVAHDPSPSRVVMGRELLEEVRRRLPEEERRIADLRIGGLGWREVAERLGGTPQALRKKFERAVDRLIVWAELEGRRHG